MSQTPDEIKSDDYEISEVKMSQAPDEINYGQQRVNYALVQIDLRIIAALKGVIDILKSVKADSLEASKLAQELNSLEAAISSVTSATKRVADIPPPGTSEQNSESFLKVARSLNLEGPPDWSSRLDDYLYGDSQRIDE